MNKKQIVVLILGIIAIILSVVLTPRYKLSWSDASQNYIITEQSSTLYNRAKGEVKFHWDKILTYSGIAVVVCGVLLFVLGGKNE